MSKFDFRHLRTRTRIEEYGRFQQHLGLIEDTKRVGEFARALGKFEGGGVVVDVGAGTGILSLLALKRGFDHAYLIEPSAKIAAYAAHLAERNNLSDRVTILNSTLEDLSLSSLPGDIELVVTETISSVIFGFGCWDALPVLVERARGRVIPARGKLYCSVTDRCFATRTPDSDGHRVLASCGLSVDLFQRTFRSGGNVFDKSLVTGAISAKGLQPKPIATFDFTTGNDPYSFAGNSFELESVGIPKGLLLYWEIELVPDDVTLSSLDPTLTSWYPYFVALHEDARLEKDDLIRMELVDLDAPYRYAFMFCNADGPISETLFW